MSETAPSLVEQAELLAKWDRGTFPTVEQSINYQHVKARPGLDALGLRSACRSIEHLRRQEVYPPRIN